MNLSILELSALSRNTSCGSLRLQIFAANLLGLGALKKVRLQDLIIPG
jgi:hypothetical protein